jgi:hypothetical protein
MTQVSQAAQETTTDRHGIGGNSPPFEVVLAERQAPLKLRVDALINEANSLPAVIETPEQHVAATTFLQNAKTALADAAAAHTVEKAPFKAGGDACDKFFLSAGLKGRLEPLTRTIANKNGAYQDRLAQARAKELREAQEKAEAEMQAKLDEAAALESQGRHTEAAVKMEGADAQEQRAAAKGQRATMAPKDLGRTHTEAGTSSLIIGAKVVIDGDVVDLEKLRPFLPVDALETAVRAMIKVKGLKPQQLLDGALVIKGVTFERTATSR